MKHLIMLFCSLLLSATFVSCDKYDDEPNYNQFSSIFSTVNTFVSKLDSNYSYSYHVNCSAKKTTSDYKFEVKPVGRLIGITSKKSMTNSELTLVEEALEWKFDSMYVVKDIYLNNSGGITIDCRR